MSKEYWYYIGPHHSFNQAIKNQIEVCEEHNLPYKYNKSDRLLILNDKIFIKHVINLQQIYGTKGNYHFLNGAYTLPDYERICEEVKIRKVMSNAK